MTRISLVPAEPGLPVLTPFYVLLCSLWLTWPVAVHAQLVADPGAPPGQRPVILDTASGLPQVDITAPGRTGVSVNRFAQFDVEPRGAIINNGRTESPTALAGWVAANPALIATPARVVVAEVSSPLPSQLQGWLEIAGSRADLIIANPAGITCNGCGFINAQRAELATGRPQWQDGRLTGYAAGPGRLTVDGRGLDARGTDVLAIFTRAAEINAGLWARQLQLTLTGPSLASGTASAPTFALDVAALGGMYAGQIVLVGTADGLGARNLGTVAADAQLVVTLDGKLANSGTLDAARVKLVATDIDNLAHGQIAGQTVAIQTGRLANAGHPDAAPVIAAAERLDIGARILENTDGALLFSGGDLAIGGTLDARGQASGRAGHVLNRAATIEALGHGRLAAERFDHQNGGVTTEEVLVSEQQGQRYLQPRGYPEKLPLAHFRWQRWSRAGQYRWRTDPPDPVTPVPGRTPLPEVDGVDCAEDGNDCQPVPGSSYPATDPAWAWFGLTPPGDAPPLAGEPPAPFALAPPPPLPSDLPADDPQQAVWRQQQAAYDQALAEHQALEAAHRGAQLARTAWETEHDLRRQNLSDAIDRYNAGFARQPIRAWTQFEINRSTYTTRVVASQPARLVTGGDLTLEGGQLTNDRSQILAGGRLAGTLDQLDSIPALGTERVRERGTSQTSASRWRGGFKRYHQRDNGEMLPYEPADALTTVELPVMRTEASVAPGAPALDVAAQRLAADGSALWQQQAGPGPLLATDPRFTRYRQWLNSDVMLAQLAADPSRQPQRLGDGYLEQQLVRAQIAQLAGRRWLPGQTDDEIQYAQLMANGVAHAQALQLRPGVALSAGQVAQLTADLVWLVETTVTLPATDGQPARTVTALAPRVYLRPRAGDLAGDGTLITGDSVKLLVRESLDNAGLLAAQQDLTLAAGHVSQSGRLSGATVNVNSATDLIQQGGSVQAREGASLAAGRDLVLQSSVRQTDRTTGPDDGQGRQRYRGSGHASRTMVDRVASVHVDGGALQLLAARDVTLDAALLTEAGNGTTVVAAGRDLTLGTVTTGQAVAATGRDTRHFLHERNAGDKGTRIDAQGEVTLMAGRDLSARAATVASADGTVALAAGQDLAIHSGQAIEEDAQGSHFKHSSMLGSQRRTHRTETSENTVAGTTVSGAGAVLQAARDLQVSGSQVVADGDVQLAAGGDIALANATATRHQYEFRQSKRSGVMGSAGVGVTVGRRKLSTEIDSVATEAVGSTVGSIGGNVTVAAAGNVQQTGSQLLAPAGDVTVVGQSVDIAAAEHAQASTARTEFRQSGVTVAVSNPVLAAAQTAQQMAQAARATDDPRMRTLAAANTALAVVQAADAVAAGQGRTIDGKPNQVTATDAAGNSTTRDATTVDKLGGIQVAISVGSASSRQQTVSTAREVAPATLAAGGDLTVAAIGTAAGLSNSPEHDGVPAPGRLQVTGSALTAGGQATLVADGAIDLQAAAATREQHSRQRNSSASMGVVIDSRQGMGVQLAGSAGRGHADGREVDWTETTVTAGESARLIAGSDAELTGAVVTAPAVTAKVGSDLVITSVQDTRTYQSRQRQVGASVVIGPVSSGQVNAAGSRIDADYASVTATAGIQAGDGGFDVQVAGDSNLTGAVIASSDAAVEADRNRFTTGGMLALADVNNHARHRANAAGVSIGTGISPEGKYLPPGTGAGLGSDSDHQASVTRAGISGIAGDHQQRTGDDGTGLVDRFDAQQVQREITAEVTITQEFSVRANQAVSAYMESQRSALRDQLKQAVNDEDKAALESQLRDLRRAEQALNILIGAVTGMPGTAITKEALSTAAEKMRELMIEDSRIFRGVTDGVTMITNVSGESKGVREDGIKLGGTRMDLDTLCGVEYKRCATHYVNGERNLKLDSNGYVQFEADKSNISLQDFLASEEGKKMQGLTGGVQGAKGTLFGIPYEAGSWQDRLIEAFAGTHDLLGGSAVGLYDEQGNIDTGMSNVRRKTHDRWAEVAIIPSAPFALAEWLPPAAWQAIATLLRSAR